MISDNERIGLLQQPVLSIHVLAEVVGESTVHLERVSPGRASGFSEDASAAGGIHPGGGSHQT
jgi:hypothetical protein